MLCKKQMPQINLNGKVEQKYVLNVSQCSSKTCLLCLFFFKSVNSADVHINSVHTGFYLLRSYSSSLSPAGRNIQIHCTYKCDEENLKYKAATLQEKFKYIFKHKKGLKSHDSHCSEPKIHFLHSLSTFLPDYTSFFFLSFTSTYALALVQKRVKKTNRSVTIIVSLPIAISILLKP